MYKVLIVDDEPWILRGIRGFFGFVKEEYRIVGEAENGRGALSLAEREKPDIIISDIRMPDMDGLEFVEGVREKRLKSRIIILSGYADFEYARQALRLDVESYLLKPLVRRELKGALDNIGERLKKERAQEAGKAAAKEEAYSEIRAVMEDIDNSYTKDFSLNDLAQKYEWKEEILQ